MAGCLDRKPQITHFYLKHYCAVPPTPPLVLAAVVFLSSKLHVLTGLSSLPAMGAVGKSDMIIQAPPLPSSPFVFYPFTLACFPFYSSHWSLHVCPSFVSFPLLSRNF